MKLMAIYKRVARAVAKGEISKAENCMVCGQWKKLHAHHENYDKPLIVLWVCCSCHRKLHKDTKRKKYKNSRTLGAHCLQKYLTMNNQSVKEFCDEAKISPPVIYRFLSGDRGISTETAIKIVHTTKKQIYFDDLVAAIQAARKKKGNGQAEDAKAA